MKYAIIIPDGAADDPLAELAGKTPLEAAHTPNMDRIAAQGRQGLVRTIPEGFESGSDVATMSLLGYDPAVYHTGRAPFEAAAQQIPLAPTDWVFRCNLVTVVDGIMKDHSAGGVSNAEAQRLIGDLSRATHIPGFEYYTGVSYCNLLVYRGHEEFDVATKPPHEIPEEPIAKHLPKGKGSEMLRDQPRLQVVSAKSAGHHRDKGADRAEEDEPLSRVHGLALGVFRSAHAARAARTSVPIMAATATIFMLDGGGPRTLAA